MRTLRDRIMDSNLTTVILFLVGAWLGVLLVNTAFGAPAAELRVNMSRVVGIDDQIGRNMDKVQSKLLSLGSDKSGEPVDIVIDSPGGSVFTGFQFVNAMEEIKGQGTRIRCFVSGIAASMAFQILVHCNERYALSRSFLLWHGVRTSQRGPITSKSAAALHADLAAIDLIILAELRESLGLKEEELLFHFNQETLHIGDNLAALAPKFITTRKYVPGLSEALHSDKVVRNSQSNPLEFFFNENDGDIQYTYKGR